MYYKTVVQIVNQNTYSHKDWTRKYCSTKTSHTGVNGMWILKISTNLLSSLGHLGVHRATSIQRFDFSTLCTSIPHDLLQSRMNNIINNVFKHKNGATLYTHIKVGRNKSSQLIRYAHCCSNYSDFLSCHSTLVT